jgi:hydroxymethylbilane synthase
VRPLRLGTRGSQLALWQARAVAERLQRLAGRSCELVIIKTSGDRLAEALLSEVGGKRLFVKEIEDALLGGDIDLAVHSAKDLPVELPPGLAIGAALPRENPFDALVLPAGADVPHAGDLCSVVCSRGRSPRIGTSSVRRSAQLRRLLPRARFEPIRGNLETRLRKLDAGEYDLIILAVAGMRRLGFSDRISLALPLSACVPAPGQGIIAVEIRTGDDGVRRVVEGAGDALAAAALAAERALVTALGGGCQAPIGALAVPQGAALELHGIVISLDGARALRWAAAAPAGEAEPLGRQVAARLVADGAAEILEEARRTPAAVEGIQP